MGNSKSKAQRKPSSIRLGKPEVEGFIETQERSGYRYMNCALVEVVAPPGEVEEVTQQPPEDDHSYGDDEHDELEDGGREEKYNTMLMINTVSFDAVGSVKNSQAPDPYIVVKCTSCPKQRYTSSVRRHHLADPVWAIRVPVLVRPNNDDVISIQVWDEDFWTPDDKVASLYLSTHRLVELHNEALKRNKKNNYLMIKGHIKTESGKKEIDVTITTEVQRWDKAYKVFGKESESHWDPYLRLLKTATQFTAAKFIDNGIVQATLIKPPTHFGKHIKTKKILNNRIELLAHDYEVPMKFSSTLFFKFLNALPFRATAKDSTFFVNRRQAEKHVQEVLGAVRGTLMATEGSWGNVTSDQSFTRYAFSNNGSSFLFKTKDGYECRLQHMQKYETRGGFERYGSVSYFDVKGRPTSIDINGEVFKVGDAGWQWAKLQARTSMFVACSGVHLILAHYMWGSIPNVAMHKCLHTDHPVRRLLHPHYFRTSNTCLNSLDTLIPARGLVHRATAFEYPALLELFDDILADFKFQTFEEELKSRGHVDEDPNFPMRTDGVEYRHVLYKYVFTYLQLYYKSDQAIVEDEQLRAFVKYAAQYMEGLRVPATLKAAASILTEMIFRVTGYHQHVGNVNIAGTSPVMISDHLVKGQLLAARESSTILAVITALTAGMLNRLGAEQYPGLKENWSQVLLDREARKVLAQFQTDLTELEKKIDKRNKKRPYVFNDFNPEFCKISVSS